MTERRDLPNQRDQAGRSRFAQRGQSHEERMGEDDSAERFPGEGRTQQDARYDAGQQPRDGAYGSGGSYGYGGGFEHRGEPGYQQHEQRGAYGRGDEFYESTGGFGRDVSGYGRAGLGYPGQGEDRLGSQGGRSAQREPAPRDDRREGFSQNAGYAQSGGEKREHTGQGSGHSNAQQGDGRGQHNGPNNQRFFGNAGGQQPGRGRFYGRTPQGYTRSDERIREDVCDRLSHGHIDPSEIAVKVEGGVVTLEGLAESRAEKFHIEEVADGVLGVKDIDNRLRIRRTHGQAPDDARRTAERDARAMNQPSTEADVDPKARSSKGAS